MDATTLRARHIQHLDQLHVQPQRLLNQAHTVDSQPLYLLSIAMPRRKSAAAAAAAAATTPTSTKSHKRQLSAAATATPASRASKRLRSSADNTPTNGKITPKKSKYFEASDEENEPSSDEASDEASESGYEDADDATEASEPPTASEDEYDSEEDAKKGRNKSGRKYTGGDSSVLGKVVEGGKALWREGVKAGLGPGKQVFIEKPKPRGDGGIKYVPGRVHPNTMAFLADLKKNNDREWLKMHDPDYRQSWNDWYVSILLHVYWETTMASHLLQLLRRHSTHILQQDYFRRSTHGKDSRNR